MILLPSLFCQFEWLFTRTSGGDQAGFSSAGSEGRSSTGVSSNALGQSQPPICVWLELQRLWSTGACGGPGSIWTSEQVV